MVSFQDTRYYGLKVSVRPEKENKVNEQYLFLTGPTIPLKISVFNESNYLIQGKIAVRVVYIISGLSSPSHFEDIFTINLSPNGAETFTVWVNHLVEGQVVVCLCDIGEPANFRYTSEESMKKKAHDADPGTALFSYKVLDETTYNIETKRTELLQEQIRSLEASMKTQIDQTIKARLAELGLMPNKSLKSEVVEEKSALPKKEDQQTAKDSSYIK